MLKSNCLTRVFQGAHATLAEANGCKHDGQTVIKCVADRWRDGQTHNRDVRNEDSREQTRQTILTFSKSKGCSSDHGDQTEPIS